jgi:hypothetical protein
MILASISNATLITVLLVLGIIAVLLWILRR